MPVARLDLQAYARLDQIAKDQARAAVALESIAESLAALVGARGRVSDYATGFLPPEQTASEGKP